MTFKPINTWGWNFSDISENFLIAGPCSAETLEQTLKSCIGAASAGAHALRAGIWKPRTRPGSFEGVGAEGLPWVKEASRITGLPAMVEVANPNHIESALKAEIEMVWIGARTMANPFSIQEIADSLKGIDIPVLIKNPINPDVDLWMGGIERIQKAGITRIAAIHRGFSVVKSAPYRNAPMWEIPIELRRRIPELPLINDPSHISGNRDSLLHITQKALDLNMDGWMIETHCNPSQAWSDAAQQITGEELKLLLEKIIKRSKDNSNPEYNSNIKALRTDIDRLDQEIIDLLGKRMMVSREIGRFKKNEKVTIFKLDRWADIFDQRVQSTKESGLSQEFAEEFIRSIHQESIRQQMRIMETDEDDGL
jgi:chorismate mutase